MDQESSPTDKSALAIRARAGAAGVRVSDLRGEEFDIGKGEANHLLALDPGLAQFHGATRSPLSALAKTGAGPPRTRREECWVCSPCSRARPGVSSIPRL